ncbi:GINS complex subunit [Modicella reniformis]|uniref:DNA replication complex GINS protein SLD5 n=1 Tax=Modicella reniformis TaxID=1440133 RepID=A0A9P6M7Q8_9FUNG|nr:GINS complex subunit [Modicella reniformis]
MSDEDDFDISGFTPRVAASRDPALPKVEPSRYVQHLTQAWINERAAPDVLQYEQASVDGLLLSKIGDQMSVIDELDSGNDTSMIISILYQTELERVKFVLRSYLRTRISKIEKHCEFILADPASKRRLSRAEIMYAENYSRATRQHFHSSFLASLPSSLQGQDDTVFNRKLNMISQPKLDEAVFCRIVEDIGDFQLDE